MADIDIAGMSLDEVIKKKGIGRGDRKRGGAGTGRGRRDGGIKKPSPKRNPKMWDNDKFFETQRGGGSRRRSDGGAISISSSGSGAKAIARLSNIPYTISQEDLDDLFGEYRLSRVALHYDFRGKSLGTAELHGQHGVLTRLARDFQNVEIDGRPLGISIVGAGSSTISSSPRVRRVGGGGGDRRRSGGGGGASSGGRRRSGGGPGAKREPRKKLTAEELDQELEDYMKGSKKE